MSLLVSGPFDLSAKLAGRSADSSEYVFFSPTFSTVTGCNFSGMGGRHMGCDTTFRLDAFSLRHVILGFLHHSTFVNSTPTNTART